MNDAQRRKLDALKIANKEYAKNLNLRHHILLQQCLQAIHTHQVADGKEAAGILAIINGTRAERFRHNDMPVIDPVHSYAVVWDETQLPVIICSGNDLRDHWEDVMAVAFDTCLVDLTQERVLLIRN